jgi:enoyl-CoA hydratase/carnithine racemase
MSNEARVTTEMVGHVMRIGLDRAAKRNAFDPQMLKELALAYSAYEENEQARCAVLFGHGEHFTAGLDLAQVAPLVAQGAPLFPADSIDPVGLGSKKRSKPVVCAVSGWCLTIGIELALASDIVIASEDTRFAQIEIKRGIFPFGGATLRWAQRSGWGNAMRWLLTGDELSAAEAYRIGLVQEVAPKGEALARATAIAQTIAEQAPLGVRATLRSARTCVEQGEGAAVKELMPEITALMPTDDAREGMMSFVERRKAKFEGR